METIYKYVLPAEDPAIVHIPRGSKILSTAFQGDDLCVWALVTTDAPNREPVPYLFHVRGTGHEANHLRNRQFVGTAFHYSGIVVHVFHG